VFLRYRPENLKPHIIGVLVSTWFLRKMLDSDFTYTYCHAEHLRGTFAVKTEYTHLYKISQIKLQRALFNFQQQT